MQFAPYFPMVILDQEGRPASGGTLSAFYSGSDIPAPIYQLDEIGEFVPAENPASIRSDGSCPVYLEEGVTYRLEAKDRHGARLFLRDKIRVGGGSGGGSGVPNFRVKVTGDDRTEGFLSDKTAVTGFLTKTTTTDSHGDQTLNLGCGDGVPTGSVLKAGDGFIQGVAPEAVGDVLKVVSTMEGPEAQFGAITDLDVLSEPGTVRSRLNALDSQMTDAETAISANTDAIAAVDGRVTTVETAVEAKQDKIITTKDDVIIGDASGNASRLAVGAPTQVLTVGPTGLGWATPTSSGAGGKAQLSVTTTQALRDLEVPELALVNETLVFCCGYWEPWDSPTRKYRYTTSTTLTDDGGSVLKSSQAADGFWVLVLDEEASEVDASIWGHGASMQNTRTLEDAVAYCKAHGVALKFSTFTILNQAELEIDCPLHITRPAHFSHAGGPTRFHVLADWTVDDRRPTDFDDPEQVANELLGDVWLDISPASPSDQPIHTNWYSHEVWRDKQPFHNAPAGVVVDEGAWEFICRRIPDGEAWKSVVLTKLSGGSTSGRPRNVALFLYPADETERMPMTVRWIDNGHLGKGLYKIYCSSATPEDTSIPLVAAPGGVLAPEIEIGQCSATGALPGWTSAPEGIWETFREVSRMHLTDGDTTIRLISIPKSWNHQNQILVTGNVQIHASGTDENPSDPTIPLRIKAVEGNGIAFDEKTTLRQTFMYVFATQPGGLQLYHFAGLQPNAFRSVANCNDGVVDLRGVTYTPSTWNGQIEWNMPDVPNTPNETGWLRDNLRILKNGFVHFPEGFPSAAGWLSFQQFRDISFSGDQLPSVRWRPPSATERVFEPTGYVSCDFTRINPAEWTFPLYTIDADATRGLQFVDCVFRGDQHFTCAQQKTGGKRNEVTFDRCEFTNMPTAAENHNVFKSEDGANDLRYLILNNCLWLGGPNHKCDFTGNVKLCPIVTNSKADYNPWAGPKFRLQANGIYPKETRLPGLTFFKLWHLVKDGEPGTEVSFVIQGYGANAKYAGTNLFCGWAQNAASLQNEAWMMWDYRKLRVRIPSTAAVGWGYIMDVDLAPRKDV